MRACLIAILALQFLAPSCGGTSEAGLPVVTIEVGGRRLRAEVASTPAQLSRGLMYRRKVGTDAGMLFVYEQEETLSFWMKNTFVPLSIAFIDADHRIVDVQDMAPQTTSPHRSAARARYALEVNRGWFERHGVGVGAKVSFELPGEDR